MHCIAPEAHNFVKTDLYLCILMKITNIQLLIFTGELDKFAVSKCYFLVVQFLVMVGSLPPLHPFFLLFFFHLFLIFLFILFYFFYLFFLP